VYFVQLECFSSGWLLTVTRKLSVSLCVFVHRFIQGDCPGILEQQFLKILCDRWKHGRKWATT
jgi:hypothetical protein